MSESHVRNIQAFGDDARKIINQNSQQFLSDFVKLLRTSHGEKKVDANHFYQEYIRDRHHMHQNATKWASLTEIVKHLGREGICRVEGKEEEAGRDGRGFMISWIDNSMEALRRQDALRRKERQDKGDEERELMAVEEQIRRARRDGVEQDEVERGEDEQETTEIKRKDGEKIRLNFGPKKADPPPSPPQTSSDASGGETEDRPARKPETPAKPVGLSLSKPKNVFASSTKKNPLLAGKKTTVTAVTKPMSEAERIMKEELERKRIRESAGDSKRQRVS